jgi:hypothetical protein
MNRDFVGLGQTELLSVPTGAVTVRRLWTGAEATNVNRMIGLVTLAESERTRGRNEERLRWWESLVTFRHPV